MRGEGVHSCPVLNHRGKLSFFHSCPAKYNIFCRVFADALADQVEEVPRPLFSIQRKIA